MKLIESSDVNEYSAVYRQKMINVVAVQITSDNIEQVRKFVSGTDDVGSVAVGPEKDSITIISNGIKVRGVLGDYLIEFPGDPDLYLYGKDSFESAHEIIGSTATTPLNSK